MQNNVEKTRVKRPKKAPTEQFTSFYNILQEKTAVRGFKTKKHC